ncbi:MAG: hypothetical protein PHF86_06155 [Candidatus Nanoarchaeia archaeon]|nr:hypothetical protein [Candidatus Nanoarchaeia archaeon]
MHNKLERCTDNFCSGFKNCENRVFDSSKEDCRECNDDAQGAIEKCFQQIKINC